MLRFYRANRSARTVFSALIATAEESRSTREIVSPMRGILPPYPPPPRRRTIDADPLMKSFPRIRRCLAILATVAAASTPVLAAEHITLRNGSEFDCVRQEATGDRVRLYLFPTAHAVVSRIPADDPNYIEVAATSVLRVETVPDPPASFAPPALDPTRTAPLSATEMREILTRAGALHNIDADLLASVVQA